MKVWIPQKPKFLQNPATASISELEISKPAEIVMTKQGIDHKITIAELQSAGAKEQA